MILVTCVYLGVRCLGLVLPLNLWVRLFDGAKVRPLALMLSHKSLILVDKSLIWIFGVVF